MTPVPAATGPASGVPRVRSWRKRVRRARREHHGRSAGDVFTDLYTLLWFVVIYGTALYSELGRGAWGAGTAGTAGTADASLARHWLGFAVLLVVAGLGWRALRAVGPMLATPAEQSWVVPTPLDRAAWLGPRLAAVLAGGAAVGALGALAVVLLGVRGGGAGAAALAGAAWGLALPATAVVAQDAGRGRRWPRTVGGVLLLLGLLAALTVVLVEYGGRALPPPPDAVGAALLTVGGVLAGAMVWFAARSLGRLDRAALGSGSQVAAAVVTSAVWLDPSVLGGVLEVRRWRRIGRVASRRVGGPLPFLPDRLAALLRAELQRMLRRPGSLAVVAGLALAQYAIAVAAPSLADVARPILAYVAAGRLTAGLRRVAGSPGLRRAIGGREAVVLGAHMVLPCLLTFAWWLATVPAGGELGIMTVVLPAGVVAAAYRAATRGPINYGGTVIETPFGLLPLDLVVSLARGPDVLGVVLLVQVLLG